MWKCQGCGAELNGDKFCPYCGRKAESAAKTADAKQEFEEDLNENLNEDNTSVVTINGIKVDMGEVIAKFGKDKIEAIKYIHHLTNLDLKESKRVVDEAYDGGIIYNINTVTRHKEKMKWWVVPLAVLIFFIFSGVVYATIGNNESRFKVETKLSTQQVKDIIAILNQCGIKEGATLDHDASLDNKNEAGEKGYIINQNNARGIILYIDKSGKASSLKWGENILFSDGKVIAKLSDFILSDEEKSYLKVTCQDLFIASANKRNLTVKYPPISEWIFDKNKERIIVEFDAEFSNGLGGKATGRLQVTFTADKSDVTSLKLDGKEYAN